MVQQGLLISEQLLIAKFIEQSYNEDHLEPCDRDKRATESSAEYVQTYRIGGAYKLALNNWLAHPTPTVADLFEVGLGTENDKESFLCRLLANHIAMLES